MAIQIEAYERKAALGGGFRAVALDEASKERFESPVVGSLAEAFGLAFDHAVQPLIDAGRAVGVGHYRGRPFRKNYFVI